MYGYNKIDDHAMIAFKFKSCELGHELKANVLHVARTLELSDTLAVGYMLPAKHVIRHSIECLGVLVISLKLPANVRNKTDYILCRDIL